MITKVSKDNIFTVEFSEVVIIDNFTLFEESLKCNIRGPSAPYTFKFEMYDPENITRTSQNLTNMQISVHDVEAPLLGDGTEVAEFWVNDLSVITDIVGNNFTEGKFSGNLNMQEYISDSKSQTNFNLFIKSVC